MPSKAGLEAVHDSESHQISSFAGLAATLVFASSTIQSLFGLLDYHDSQPPTLQPYLTLSSCPLDLPILPMKVCLRTKDDIYFQRVKVFRPLLYSEQGVKFQGEVFTIPSHYSSAQRMPASTVTRSIISAKPVSSIAPSIAPPIRYDLRSYTRFNWPESRSKPPPLSIPSQYFGDEALSQSGLATMTDPSTPGVLNYIDLPPHGASNASMTIEWDARGVHVDPRIQEQTSQPGKDTTPSSQKASSVSLLPSCTSLAVVKDPSGQQRIVAVGIRNNVDDGTGDGKWMLVSATLPKGITFPDGQRSAGSVVTDCAIRRESHQSVSKPGRDPSECSCQ